MNNYNVEHVAKAALAVLIENVTALTTFLFVRLFWVAGGAGALKVL